MLVALTADGVERRGAPVLVASFDHKANYRITNIKMRFPAHDERESATHRGKHDACCGQTPDHPRQRDHRRADNRASRSESFVSPGKFETETSMDDDG